MLIVPEECTAKKQILLSVIVAAPEPFFANSTIYIHIGLNGEDNSKFSTSLIINRDRGRKRFIKFNLKSGDSNPNRKWTRSNATTTRRLSVMKWYPQEASLKDIADQ